MSFGKDGKYIWCHTNPEQKNFTEGQGRNDCSNTFVKCISFDTFR